MPEIVGSLSRDGTVKGTCCWCGTPSTSSGVAPGLQGSPEIPLHVLCAAMVIRAYNEWRRTGLLSPGMEAYLDRLGRVPPLPAGVE